MARARARLFVLCALLAGLAQTVADVIVLRNTNPAIRFANVSWTSQSSNVSMSPCILHSDDPRATITVALPVNAGIVQWYSMRPSDAATYLVCVDCNDDSDWQRSVVVDARGSSATAPSLIWTSKQLDPNVNHTMVVRNVVDPRFNTWSTVSMDALVVQTGTGDPNLPIPTPIPPPPTPSPTRYMIPVVVLSIIGGVALLLTILIILFYLRRKRAARRPSAQWHKKYFEQDDKPTHGPDPYAYASLRSERSDAQYRADVASNGLYNSTPWLKPSPRHESQGSAWSQRARELPPLPESPRPTQEPPVSSDSASVATAQPPTVVLASVPPPSPSPQPDPIIPTAAPSDHGPSHQHVVAPPPVTYTDPFNPPSVPLQHQEPLAPIKKTSVAHDSQPLYDGRESEPPAPMQPTFADAAAHRENSTDSIPGQSPSVAQIPPLPYQLPPTRPVSYADTVMEIPLPDFEPTPTLPTPGPARTQSNVRPGHRRPAGPRIASGSGVAAPIRRTITQTTVASIPEESLSDGSAKSPAALTTGSESPLTPGHRPTQQNTKLLPELPFDQLFASPMTGSTDDSTPLSAFPNVPDGNDPSKSKTPSKRWPAVQIPVGRRAGGAGRRKPPPTRKSTASTMASSGSGPLSRAPTLIRWEPDFLEIESTPEGSRMVTVGAQPHRERGGSASLSPQTSPLQDSPLDVGLTDWEDEGLHIGHWLSEPPMRQDSGANASSVRSTSGGTVASTMRRMLTGDASARYQLLDDP